MAATAQNVSFASPLADAKFAQIAGDSRLNNLAALFSGVSGWQVAITILLVLVAYDQCTSSSSNLLHPILTTLHS